MDLLHRHKRGPASIPARHLSLSYADRHGFGSFSRSPSLDLQQARHFRMNGLCDARCPLDLCLAPIPRCSVPSGFSAAAVDSHNHQAGPALATSYNALRCCPLQTRRPPAFVPKRLPSAAAIRFSRYQIAHLMGVNNIDISFSLLYKPNMASPCAQDSLFL